MKKCILIHLAALSLALLGGCQSTEKPVDSVAQEIQNEIKAVVGLDCTIEPTKEVTFNQGTVSLPARGFFVMESHYATREQKFGDGRLFPKDQKEGIDLHLKQSCEFMKFAFPDLGEDCPTIYHEPSLEKYTTVWTPPEGGKAGQGAVGNLKPTAEQEIWQGNMYWKGKSKPKPGTRYLICNESKTCVVISMGYEIGPGDKKFLGGVTREVHWALGAKNGSLLTLGKLKDQSLPYGPVTCK